MPADKGELDAVYNAESQAEIGRLYDRWAERYDADMARAGYRHPSICLALFSRHVPRGSAPVLDAGAGTGLVGEWLGIVGYPQVEALDISRKMLGIARRKNIYTALHEAALGQPLPFHDGEFAAVVAVGVFTTGHVGPEGLDELARVCRCGGAIVLTVKSTLWDQGFSSKIDQLTEQGLVTVLEKTTPYVSMPGEPDTISSKALVLGVLR